MIYEEGFQRRTLKEILEDKGFNQKSFAEALNVRHATVNVWLRSGTVPTQPPSVYLKMCRLLGLTLEELVEIFEGTQPLDGMIEADPSQEN